MPENKTETTETTVSVVEIDNIDDLLGTPGADNIMLPDEKKPTLFSKNVISTQFLDNEPTTENSEEESSDDEKKNETTKRKPEEPIDTSIIDIPGDDVEEEKRKPGRPKAQDKDLIGFVSSLIDEGLITPFDDDKPFEEYTSQDIKELIEENFKFKDKKAKEEAPGEFFNLLPNELKIAAKYAADGGKDFKGLFRHLAAKEEINDLSVTNEDDHENIVRAYLHATKFGDSEFIESEIEKWRDRDELEGYATKFKPKLDNLQDQIIEQKIRAQEESNKRRAAIAKNYSDSIYDTLDKDNLNGLKLDNKTKSALFTGLIQPNYPASNGSKVNLLGYLLEKHQYIEPNHGLIAEALWLLNDPENYKAKVRESAEKQTTEKHVRMLKTEQANKQGSSNSEDERSDSKSPKIPRPSKAFFKR